MIPTQSYSKSRPNWLSWREDPHSIAERLRRFSDEIGTIDETLRPWVLGGKSAIPSRFVGCDLAEMIRRDVKYGQDGKIESKAGYSVLGWSEDNDSKYPMWNGVMFESHAGVAVNETVATYALMKQVALAMIACWEPAICFTRSSG